MMSHKCHARGCGKDVPQSRLMCGYHWKLCPRPLQLAVWRYYRKGQEIDKQPSPEYLNAALEAVEAVAEIEGKGKTASLF